MTLFQTILQKAATIRGCDCLEFYIKVSPLKDNQQTYKIIVVLQLQQEPQKYLVLIEFIIFNTCIVFEYYLANIYTFVQF